MLTKDTSPAFYWIMELRQEAVPENYVENNE